MIAQTKPDSSCQPFLIFWRCKVYAHILVCIFSVLQAFGVVSAIVRTAAYESVFSKYFLSLTLRECPTCQRARSGSQKKILTVMSRGTSLTLYITTSRHQNQTDILRVGCYSSEKRTGLLPRAMTMILRCIVAASVLLLAHGLSFPFGRSRRRILLDEELG